MSDSDLDITTLIVCVCVIIPALIALSVCGVIYCAYRQKDRKPFRSTNRPLSYQYEQTRERAPQNSYVIDFSHINQLRQQRRSRPSPPLPPVIEQSPPSYYISIDQSRRQQTMPAFSTIRTLPLSETIHRSSPIITPSIHSAMPPSYAEIFLKPHTLPNG